MTCFSASPWLLQSACTNIGFGFALLAVNKEGSFKERNNAVFVTRKKGLQATGYNMQNHVMMMMMLQASNELVRPRRARKSCEGGRTTDGNDLSFSYDTKQCAVNLSFCLIVNLVPLRAQYRNTSLLRVRGCHLLLNAARIISDVNAYLCPSLFLNQNMRS